MSRLRIDSILKVYYCYYFPRFRIVVVGYFQRWTHIQIAPVQHHLPFWSCKIFSPYTNFCTISSTIPWTLISTTKKDYQMSWFLSFYSNWGNFYWVNGLVIMLDLIEIANMSPKRNMMRNMRSSFVGTRCKECLLFDHLTWIQYYFVCYKFTYFRIQHLPPWFVNFPILKSYS